MAQLADLDYRYPLFLNDENDSSSSLLKEKILSKNEKLTNHLSHSSPSLSTSTTTSTISDQNTQSLENEKIPLNLDEPHQKRKLTILTSHPEITSLYGTDSRSFWISLFLTLFQLYMTIWISTNGKDLSIHSFILLSFLIGGTATKILGIVIHEACHNLVFKSVYLNIGTGFLSNTTIPFPIAMSFRRYHLMHHAYQGIQGKDPDLPVAVEAWLFNRNSFTKLIYLCIYPVFYISRGLTLKLKPSRLEVYNLIFTLTVNLVLFILFGYRAIIYLILSLWFGYTIHPAAAHFIQEHFVWKDGQETYSYYGPLNNFFLNIGYHVEHHDFMEVPWSNLPAVKSIAPEFYLTLFNHRSWIKLFWDFVKNTNLGPAKRYRRSLADHVRGREMMRQCLSQKSKKL